jgi:molecular chaperone HtpG
MPVEIEFEGEVINNTKPLWLKKPSEISREEYLEFYSELHPLAEEPLFWIHLNVDYPFNLTGILYFPKVGNAYELHKNKIQLYSNQVFVTDEVKEIVPEFLTLLHGVIDSPDIPLNVSRSYLQADSNVKKISAYIVKKVGEKLHEIFRNQREEFEQKWEDIGFFIKYGMLADEKFYEKAKDFVLLQSIEGSFSTLEEYREKIKDAQTDKNDQQVWLYASEPSRQDSFIEAAQKRGYDVIRLEHPLDPHFVQMLESKLEKLSIKRVDSDTADKLIEKDEKRESVLSEKEIKAVEDLYKAVLPNDQYRIKHEALSPEDAPVLITQSEWMRRMRDMSKLQGVQDMGMFPGSYEVVVNTNHPLAKKLTALNENEKQEGLARQLFDLARLSQNLLTGKELTAFIGRTVSYIE